MLYINSSNTDVVITPFFAPVWSHEGKLLALEMLSRIELSDNNLNVCAESFFKDASVQCQMEILFWQFEVIDLISKWFIDKNVLLTLNLNNIMADIVLTSPLLCRKVHAYSPFLRIEISEYFLVQDCELYQDRVISELSKLTRLWLDDFGCGSTSLRWLTDARLEAIKIDKHLFWKMSRCNKGASFLRSLSLLAEEMNTHMILEGVADIKLLRFAKKTKAYAFQGWLWQGSELNELNNLPLLFPKNKLAKYLVK